MLTIDIIAGARPNFMKVAPIIRALRRHSGFGDTLTYRLVHTGQHFDDAMSGLFFRQLDIPDPNRHLGAGGGSQAEQTAKIMVEYEKVLFEEKPDLTLVVGDVTSTMACTITARKMGVRVAHVEAGIRSGDWSMPEEINRVVTDSICDLFYTTSQNATDNLLYQGIPANRIIFVGNTMIDSLLYHRPDFRCPEVLRNVALPEGGFWVLTLHRPANVDDPKRLEQMLQTVDGSRAGMPVVFPVHPRTRKNLPKGLQEKEGWLVIEPQGYLEFNYLVERAKGVITDSGGVTEEATVMGIPCLTLRKSTERPETVTMGTNHLVGDDLEELRKQMEKIAKGAWKKGSIPLLWDGKSAQRIVDHLLSYLQMDDSRNAGSTEINNH